MNVAFGNAESLFSLSLKDNGVFAGKATEFRVTVFFTGGERAHVLADGEGVAVDTEMKCRGTSALRHLVSAILARGLHNWPYPPVTEAC